MLRAETKSRARALQLLYAWEMHGGPPVPGVASGLSRLTGPEPRILDRAEELAQGVVGGRGRARRRGGARQRELAARPDRAWSSGTSSGSASSSCAGARCRPRWRSTRRCGWRTGSAARGRPGFVNGVLDGIARDARAPVNVLVVNWQDRENPQAGGAEIHLFEIFRRLAARGPSGAAGVLRLARAPRRGPRSTASRSSARAPRHSFALRRPRRGAARAPGRAAGRAWSRTSTSCRSSSPGMTRPPVLRDRAAPVRRDRIRGGAVADGRRGLGGRAAAGARLPHGRGSTPSARARATTWWRAACAPDRDPGHSSRRGRRALHPGARRPPRRDPHLLVRWTVEAL